MSRKRLQEIIIYPNPVDNKININTFVDLNVYNMLGDMIISKTNINVLDVSRLHSGVYNIQIMHDEKTINKRIIKK